MTSKHIETAAPERIWTRNETINIWIAEKQDDTVEYVRADLATQAEAERDRSLLSVGTKRTLPAFTMTGQAKGSSFLEKSALKLYSTRKSS